jgi:outer membrane usher protein FimD/PapC
MPDAARIHLRLLLPAVAGALCAAPSARGESLSIAPAPGQPKAAAVRPAPGIEINYELLAPAETRPGAGRLDGSISGASGELRSSVLVDSVDGATRVTRLDTRWQTQAPGPLQTLVVGDTFGSGGGWSRPVRLGGVRFGRSLVLRPGFAATQATLHPAGALPPMPLAFQGGRVDGINAASAAAPAPSTAPRQPALGTPQPLAAGASDHEVEVGRVRTGWGTADDRYGEGYAAAAYRQGLGAELTAEGRAEWSASRAAAGLEVTRSFGPAGSVHALLAHSDSPQQSGLRWGMGMVRNAEGAAWTLSWDGFDRGFTPAGTVAGEADPRGRVEADARWSFAPGASAGLSYMRQATWDLPAERVLGATASFRLGESSRLSMNYSQRAGTQPGWQAGLTLELPLGRCLASPGAC